MRVRREGTTGSRAANVLLGTWLILLVACTGTRQRDAAGGSAADPAAKQGEPKLALVTSSASHWWNVVVHGARRYESEEGVHVDVRMPAKGTVEQQDRILTDLTNEGFDAVAVHAVAPRHQVAALTTLAQRMSLITFAEDVPACGRALYIGTDHRKMGQTLGAEIVRRLPAGGEIAAFVGDQAPALSVDRIAGIRDAIAGHGVELGTVFDDQADRARARANVVSAVQQNPRLKAVVGIWAYNGTAIAAALAETKMKGKILALAFDEEEGTLDGVADGTISLTVAQEPAAFGYLASKWMHRLATQGDAALQELPPGRRIDTGFVSVTADNVKAFRQELIELGAPL
jgi:ribose transport system substrate-binding protein